MDWGSEGLKQRFLMYLGRGNGGTFAPDELWMEDRIWAWLSDAQESVYTTLAAMAPDAIVSPPVQMVTNDGGITYSLPNGAYPMGHAEVYGRQDGYELYASSYTGWSNSGFVIEGGTIRMPRNRARVFSRGLWMRGAIFPARISASVEPSLMPEAARELILFRAVANAMDVSAGEMDPTPFEQRYSVALNRWLTVWATQYNTIGSVGLEPDDSLFWWRDWWRE